VKRTSLLLLASAMAVVSLPGTSEAGASSAPVPLAVAQYAIDTGSHHRPAQGATPIDVANAAESYRVNAGGTTFDVGASGYTLIANLGALEGHPRVIAFGNSTTYADTCVYVPSSIGGTATLTRCPMSSIYLVGEIPVVMEIARQAVKDAALRGRAVSSQVVISTAKAFRYSLAHVPSFRAGAGGTADFEVKVPSKTWLVCIRFPKVEFGIPLRVTCPLRAA
jgi:hypothetical protein